MPSSADAFVEAEAIIQAACIRAAADVVVARGKLDQANDPFTAIALHAMEIRAKLAPPSKWQT